MYSIKMEMKGIENARKYTSQQLFKLNQNKISGLDLAGQFVEGEVIESVGGRRAEPRSVKTGRFISSIQKIRLNDNEVVIFSVVPYSIYLENGTRRMQPRRHFFNTAQRSKDMVQQVITASILK